MLRQLPGPGPGQLGFGLGGTRVVGWGYGLYYYDIIFFVIILSYSIHLSCTKVLTKHLPMEPLVVSGRRREAGSEIGLWRLPCKPHPQQQDEA